MARFPASLEVIFFLAEITLNIYKGENVDTDILLQIEGVNVRLNKKKTPASF